jgi:predicted RNase H-like nuclease (RuvC/YqgF family)
MNSHPTFRNPTRTQNMTMRNSAIWLSCLILSGALLPSCHKEDPALLRKNEEQKAEIKRLEGELAVLDEKLKNAPPDRSEDLAAVRKDAESQEAEIANLEKEVPELQARKKALETEFKQYREKYPVKSN